MGNLIIDTERTNRIYRCNNVKKIIVYISLIGSPISLTVLLFGIFTMILSKKKISFLTKLIILIFISEALNSISKILQILKYYYPDLRNDKSFEHFNTPRSIICQIQIVSSIYSDLCTLIGNLILSLRCYDVIKNKRRFFDKGKNGTLTIIFIIIFPIGIGIGLLFLDRSFTKLSYRYDVRDRCSYWCWLYHTTSLICFGIYIIFIILNIVFACKTISFLKKGYKKLIKENEIICQNSSITTPLNDISKDNNNIKNSQNEETTEKKFVNLTSEEKKRIDELKLMRVKCLIYPWVTIILWVFAATYRIADFFFVKRFDNTGDPDDNEEDEEKYFKDHPKIHFFVQFFLALHAFLSSIRGLLYGFSFVIFEEKIFFNFFRSCWEKYFKDDELKNIKEEEKLVRNSENSSSVVSDYNDNKSEKKDEDDKSDVVEMNTSDYHYNDN